jgi:hypothetical protein
MFKLIKLGIYVLLGYTLYELYQGMMSGQYGGGMSGGMSGGNRGREFSGSGEGRFTGGAGGGMSETTGEPGGASVTHNVGRGVM